MMWGQLETVAQIAVGHVLNSLPEGLLIALFAWMMLRILPRQNAITSSGVSPPAPTTAAVTASPHSRSGMPKTAASRTVGCS